MVYSTLLNTITFKLIKQTIWTACIPLSLILGLSACDNFSSNTDTSESTAAQALSSNNQEAIAIASQQAIANGAQDTESSDNDSSSEEGNSLLAAAKSDTDILASGITPVQRSSHSILQATLIGDYMGMMPCAFCDSTEVVLNLYADGSMLKTSVYENADMDRAPLVEEGIYRQNEDMITIAYTNSEVENYHIQGNHLILMHANKELNTDYTLSRQ